MAYAKLIPTPKARAAAEAVSRGWSVVPMHCATAGRCSCGDQSSSPGKHARTTWKKRMEDAASAEQVRQWWRRWPDANVGVVTGGVSGIVVLDVDPRHGGGDSLATLEAIYGPLPRTIEALTGGGGQHLYFHHPGTVVPSRSITPGLDVKGDGGLVVCPPSAHVSGRSYAWEAGCAPGKVPLADLPWWIQTLSQDATLRLRRQAHRPTRCRRGLKGERADFAGHWAQVGITLRPGDHRYLCPFHNDHHPSLHIDAEGCRFYCFGCGRGGGIGRLRRLLANPTRRSRCRSAPAILPLRSPRPRPLSQAPTKSASWGESSYQDHFDLTGGQRHTVACIWERIATLYLSLTIPQTPWPSP